MTKSGKRNKERKNNKIKQHELSNKEKKNVEKNTVVVGWLVAERPSNIRVYLKDGSAQTSLRAATLR